MQLEREQHACARWDQDHSPQLHRAEVARQELAARHAARLAALEHDPPADLVAELGHRPAHPVAAQAWRSSIAAIERNQVANGVDDVEPVWDRTRADERLGMANEAAAEAATAWTEPGRPQGIEQTDGLTTDL
jgi:hypothetical protein